MVNIKEKFLLLNITCPSSIYKSINDFIKENFEFPKTVKIAGTSLKESGHYLQFNELNINCIKVLEETKIYNCFGAITRDSTQVKMCKRKRVVTNKNIFGIIGIVLMMAS